MDKYVDQENAKNTDEDRRKSNQIKEFPAKDVLYTIIHKEL